MPPTAREIEKRFPFCDRLSVRPQPQRPGADFLLYGADASYFTGKLEMYFRYKEYSFEHVEFVLAHIHGGIFDETGCTQAPQVYDARPGTPDSQRWLRDTTGIIQHLEADTRLQRLGAPADVLPACPVQRFFCLLLEDFADEMLWRPAMYYRWEPELDSHALSLRFTYELARALPTPLPRFLHRAALHFRQWLVSVEGEDLVTDEQKGAVEAQYHALLDALEPLLDAQPFILGARPTIADFGLAGPLFRHFASDPTPRKIMQQRAPAVYLWVARLWHARESRAAAAAGAFPAAGALPAGWAPLLAQVRDYLDYSAQNAAAHAAGQHTFAFSQHRVTFASPVVPYRAWCRAELQREFRAIRGAAPRARCEALLREHGLWELLWDGPDAASRPAPPPELGCAPPFCVAARVNVHTGGTPKWPNEPVLARYLRRRLPRALRRAAVAAALLLLRALRRR